MQAAPIFCGQYDKLLFFHFYLEKIFKKKFNNFLIRQVILIILCSFCSIFNSEANSSNVEATATQEIFLQEIFLVTNSIEFEYEKNSSKFSVLPGAEVLLLAQFSSISLQIWNIR